MNDDDSNDETWKCYGCDGDMLTFNKPVCYRTIKDQRQILDIWFDSHNQAFHVWTEAANCKDTEIVAASMQIPAVARWW